MGWCGGMGIPVLGRGLLRLGLGLGVGLSSSLFLELGFIFEG